MSKLYDTLERIHKLNGHKTSGVQGPLGRPYLRPQRRGRTWFGFLILGVCSVALAIAFYLFLPQIKTHLSLQQKETLHEKRHGKTVQQSKGEVVSRKKEEQRDRLDPVALNNRAVELFKEKAYWDGLFLLDQVIGAHPDFEPAYENTIYGLVQMGFYGAAQEYCKRLRARFGDTDWLRENRQSLLSLGIDPDT